MRIVSLRFVFSAHELALISAGVEYARPHRRLFVHLVGLLGLTTAAEMLPPLATKYLFDNVFDAGSLSLLYSTLLVLSGLFVLNAVVGGLKGVVDILLNKTLARHARHTIFQRLMALPQSYFDGRSAGKPVHRVMADVDELVRMLVFLLVSPWVNLFTFVICGGIGIWLDWRLTLLVLALTPLSIANVRFFTSRIQRESRLLGEANADSFGFLYESFTSTATVKLFGMEPDRGQKFRKIVDSLFARATSLERLGLVHGLVSAVLANAGWLVVVAYGGTLVLRGEMTLGSLLVFLAIYPKLSSPFEGLLWLYQQVRTALPAVERIQDALAYGESSILSPASPSPTPEKAPTIEFAGVSFSYEDDREALSNLCFTARAASFTAIVGPSGSGKSTMASLLARLYDPQRGAILLDGIDHRRFDIKSLRAMLAYVSQAPSLFSGTVAYNIGLGLAGDAEIERAAVAANAHEFISELPDGYDTVVGAQGRTLSAGQTQRVALARALVREPLVLVLDEATSNIDPESEAAIQAALQNVAKARTVLVIAHRLNTVADADHIVFLEEGKVVEEGRHDELMSKQGRYADLAESGPLSRRPVQP